MDRAWKLKSATFDCVCALAAAEKQKFVYILNRDSSNRLTISSPLEAHKSYALCFSVVGVDVHFENPIFACIEVDYNDQVHCYYEELIIAAVCLM